MAEFDGNNLEIQAYPEKSSFGIRSWKTHSFYVNQVNIPESDHQVVSRVGSRTLSYNSKVSDGDIFTMQNVQMIQEPVGIEWSDYEFGYMEGRAASFFVNEPIALYGAETTIIKTLGQVMIPPNIIIQ